MPSNRGHTRLSRLFLEELSLGSFYQTKLDEHSNELGPRHRAIDHTWERLNRLADLYGPLGYAEILIHLGADYGLLKLKGAL